MRALAAQPTTATLPALVFTDMVGRSHSRAAKLSRPDKVLACRDERFADLIGAYTTVNQRGPSRSARGRLSAIATDIALSEWCWHRPALLLLPLQRQPWHSPHPAAYVAGRHAMLLARWLCNSIPGSADPCPNCSGAYPLSRYHVTRCVDAESRLDALLDDLPIALCAPRRNCLDVAALSLCPRPLTQRLFINRSLADIVRSVHQALKDRLPPTGPSDERREIALHAKTEEFAARLSLLGGIIRDIIRRCLASAPRGIG
jgi:hypothetical protein